MGQVELLLRYRDPLRPFFLFDSVQMGLYQACAKEMYSD
jgi:hypothetical protein